METFLLTTKLYIPPPHLNLVSRPHLIERLDEGLRLGHRLTLISASAGSGKTTLLGEWMAAHNLGFGWLSLDEDDNDPARFWSYAIAALQTIRPQLGQSTLPMLHGLQPLPAQAVLTPLLNELAALAKPVILILDDYHLITEKVIHDGVTFLLDHLPHPLHLVIATRVDPPLPLARWRSRG
ncbi:MAG: hypothetical protein JXA33_10275, partial [Anaerolineae bacterium]|nr:hypothetical protein [Anaerolineae bacterium]